jgi:hypothetical protein
MDSLGHPWIQTDRFPIRCRTFHRHVLCVPPTCTLTFFGEQCRGTGKVFLLTQIMKQFPHEVLPCDVALHGNCQFPLSSIVFGLAFGGHCSMPPIVHNTPHHGSHACVCPPPPPPPPGNRLNTPSWTLQIFVSKKLYLKPRRVFQVSQLRHTCSHSNPRSCNPGNLDKAGPPALPQLHSASQAHEQCLRRIPTLRPIFPRNMHLVNAIDRASFRVSSDVRARPI